MLALVKSSGLQTRVIGDVPHSATHDSTRSDSANASQSLLLKRIIIDNDESISDGELLGLILGWASPEQDNEKVGKALLEGFGSLADAITAPVWDLRATIGLSESGIAALKVMRLASLRLIKPKQGKPILSNWDALLKFLSAKLSREKKELFYVLFLDGKNQLIADEVIGKGTVNHTPVYPREVAKRSLELNATALILVHNHPSGDPKPSMYDIEVTAKVKQAVEALGIVLHDHLIIGNGSHYSLKRTGHL